MWHHRRHWMNNSPWITSCSSPVNVEVDVRGFCSWKCIRLEHVHQIDTVASVITAVITDVITAHSALQQTRRTFEDPSHHGASWYFGSLLLSKVTDFKLNYAQKKPVNRLRLGLNKLCFSQNIFTRCVLSTSLCRASSCLRKTCARVNGKNWKLKSQL